MPTYMTQFTYTREAWAAMTKKPEDRGAAFRALIEKMGGHYISIYYSLGEYDGLVLYEAPDDQTAAAAIVAAVAPGHLNSTKTTVLFTMEETMNALRKAGGATYSAPRG